MQISGIGAEQDVRSIAMPKKNDNHPEVDNLQRQIEEKKKQLQELGKDDRLSPEQKQKKRESIQQEITELEAQKNQAEMAEKQNEQEEAREKLAKRSDDSYNRNKDGDTAQISARGMQALITAGTAMDMADVKGRVKTTLDGDAGILESEIKIDQARGVDTAKKEEQLGEIIAKANDLNRQSMNDMEKANEEIQSGRRREQEDRKSLGKDADDDRTAIIRDKESTKDTLFQA